MALRAGPVRCGVRGVAAADPVAPEAPAAEPPGPEARAPSRGRAGGRIGNGTGTTPTPPQMKAEVAWGTLAARAVTVTMTGRVGPGAKRPVSVPGRHGGGAARFRFVAGAGPVVLCGYVVAVMRWCGDASVWCCGDVVMRWCAVVQMGGCGDVVMGGRGVVGWCCCGGVVLGCCGRCEW